MEIEINYIYKNDAHVVPETTHVGGFEKFVFKMSNRLFYFLANISDFFPEKLNSESY